MALPYINQNQILGISLVPQELIKWNVNDNLYPFSQCFHLRPTQKKILTIAYKSGNKYYSLSDGKEVSTYDAIITLSPSNPLIRLILECDDITFKSSPDVQRAGVLYTNKLEYSLPKISTTTDANKLEQQLLLLQSGKAYHLLFHLYGCDAGKSIVLCPDGGAFQAKVEDAVTSSRITITVKNLTSHQFLQ